MKYLSVYRSAALCLVSSTALSTMLASNAYAQAVAATPAAPEDQQTSDANADDQQNGAVVPATVANDPIAQQDGEIVVTARQRSESLMSVPVAVSAVGAPALARANVTDLAKLGEIVPAVIISSSGQTGGGSIGIRGISSPANVAGFEQDVSVAIDGVLTSNGKVAQIGIFDVEQVEVMKGPQALFFGKNSPAGVISVKTKGPTDTFQISGSAAVEPVGRELTYNLAVSGPMGGGFGYRVAAEYRDLDGWLKNDARPVANPFYNPQDGAPAGLATLPGASSYRYGNHEVRGRVTLDYDKGGPFSAWFKAYGNYYHDDGAGTPGQNIGPCTGDHPRVYGVPDPYGECKIDNHTSNGNISLTQAAGLPESRGDGKAYTARYFYNLTYNMSLDLDPVTITALTGYNNENFKADYGLDNTTFSQLWATEHDDITEFSQELRAVTNFSGPLNLVAGLYYQSTDRHILSDVALRSGVYRPETGRYDDTDNRIRMQGKTYSAFGQVLFNITDQIELDAGGRFTRETKDDFQRVIFGQGPFDVVDYTFPGESEPGVLTGHYAENNFSPEVTLTWHPSSYQTLYASYRTGFKSGGFTAGLPTRATRIGDLDFGSSKAKGGEIGYKGQFFDRKLKVTLTGFYYNFDQLQVNAYDPVRVAFVVGNAGAVHQRGVETELNYQATDWLSLHAAATYAHNRFKDYSGACYSYTFPTGTTRDTATPPPNCSFATATGLTLQQVFDDRAPARSPDLTASGGFLIDYPVGDNRVTLSGDAFYTDGYYASDTMAPTTYQNAFVRANASISYGAYDDRWKLSLIGRNIFNKYYMLYASDRTGGASIPGAIGEQRAYVARGAEVNIQASFKF